MGIGGVEIARTICIWVVLAGEIGGGRGKRFGGVALSGGVADSQVVLEAEGEVAFGGDVEFFATSEGLGAGSGCASGESSNGCAFAASGDCADEGSGCCAAADVFAGARVFADALLLIASLNVGAFYGIAHAANADGAEIDGEGIVIADGGERSGRSAGDEHSAICAEDVSADASAIEVRGVGALDVGVDGLVGANGDFGSAGDGGALGYGG